MGSIFACFLSSPDQHGLQFGKTSDDRSGVNDCSIGRRVSELFRVRVADLVGESPEADDEPAEMVAMFRDLKQLEERDRDTIRMLMEQMKKRKADER